MTKIQTPKENTYRSSLRFVSLGIAVALLALDQYFKHLAVTHLKNKPSKLIIPKVLQFTYVENRGAAFGIFQGRRFLLVILVGLILAAMVYFLLSGRIENNFITLMASGIIAGGLGNLIDRILYGYVIDFIDVTPLFSFPVFNFADCCVVVSSVLILLYLFIRGDDLLADTGDSESFDD